MDPAQRTKRETFLEKQLNLLQGRFAPIQKENERLLKEIGMMKENEGKLVKEIGEMREEIGRQKDREKQMEEKRVEKEAKVKTCMEHQRGMMKRKIEEANIEKKGIAKENEQLKTTIRDLELQLSKLKTEQFHSKEKEKEMKEEKKKEEDKVKRLLNKKPRKVLAYGRLNRRQSRYLRIKKAFAHLKQLSGNESTTFFKDLVHEMARKKELKLKLTAKEAFQLYHRSRQSRKNWRFMKKFLTSSNVFDPFPSLSEITTEESEVGAMYKFSAHESTSPKNPDKIVTVVKLDDVVGAIASRIESLLKNHKLVLDGFDSIWITIQGDKGSEETKICLTIANVPNSNSCYHLLPVGIYDDDDSAACVLRHLGSTIDQLSDLKSVKISHDGVDYDVPIKFFLGGDLKWQYEMVGHQGATANHPCLLCTTKLKDLVKDYQRGKDFELRSSDSYVQDSLKGNVRPVNSVKPGSKIIFPCIDIPNVIPGSLHHLMGLAQRYGLDYLLLWAAQMDCHKNITRKDIKNRRIARTKLDDLENEIKSLHLEIDSISLVSKVLLSFSSRLIDGDDDLESKKCPAERCLFRDRAMASGTYDRRFVNCSACDVSVHSLCAGCWTSDDFKSSLEPETVVETLLDDLESHKLGKENEYNKEKEEFDNDMTALKGESKTRILLESKWKSWGADMSVWKQNFTGNQVYRLLQPAAIQDYMSIFFSHPHYNSMKAFLLSLGAVQRLSVPRKLTTTELELMEQSIDTIWLSIQEFAPDDTVTPKLHNLLEHVMDFTRRHGTWAKTSEQGIEAYHAAYNTLKLQFRTIKNRKLRASYIFRSLLFKNSIFDYQSIAF
ncbi:unnamed protein product [Caenorhabditis nigoni]